MAYLVKRGRAFDADMLRSFDSMVERVFGSAGVNLAPFPSVDVRESDDRYTIEVELPGYSADEIDLELKDNVLRVSSTEETGNEVSSARRRRAFNRRFSVPRDVNRDGIHATLENGLLTLRLDKQPEAQPRRIEIQAN